MMKHRCTRNIQKVLSLTYSNIRETGEIHLLFNIITIFVDVKFIAISDFFDDCKIEKF